MRAVVLCMCVTVGCVGGQAQVCLVCHGQVIVAVGVALLLLLLKCLSARQA